jgi:hypothetical protein
VGPSRIPSKRAEVMDAPVPYRLAQRDGAERWMWLGSTQGMGRGVDLVRLTTGATNEGAGWETMGHLYENEDGRIGEVDGEVSGAGGRGVGFRGGSGRLIDRGVDL